MYREQEYCFKLNYLINKNLLNDFNYTQAILHKTRIYNNSKRFCLNKKLIDTCSEKVEENISNSLNYNLYMLSIFRLEFTSTKNNNLILSSVYFILYCLMVDKLLDNQGTNMKIQTNQYSWKNVRRFITGDVKSSKKTLFDEIFVFIYNNLNETNINPKFKKYVTTLAKNAIVSEFSLSNISMYDLNSNIPEKLIIDKSASFIEASLLMTVMDLNNEKMNNITRAAKALSLLLTFADDLVDLYSDIYNLRTNLVLYKTKFDFGQERTFFDAIDMIIDTEIIENCIIIMEKELHYIKTHCSKKFYMFSKALLYDWFSEIRAKLLS